MGQTSDVILERMMTLHPKVIDLTLGRVERLLGALGHPERAIPPVIHIAGTNGKGSTQAMIRAGLEAGGETVHADDNDVFDARDLRERRERGKRRDEKRGDGIPSQSREVTDDVDHVGRRRCVGLPRR